MIALVSICSPEFMKVPPLGILYVGNALKVGGHDVKLLHFPPEEIESRALQLARENPLFVGISAFTSNQTNFSARFCREFRRQCDAPVVWGGVHASMNPEQTLAEDYVDMVVIGEGEETIIDLADALTEGRDLHTVESLGFKEDGKPVFTGQRDLIKDLDRFKLDWDLVDIERYLVPMWGRKRTISFVTSRGCPYRCGFCYNVRFNRGRWRAHSRDHVIREIENLKARYGVDGIRFYDDNFFANKKRAIEILEAVDLPWEGQIRIGYITDEIAQKLSDTKCQGLCFGMETGSDRILDLIHKDQHTDEIMRGTRIMARHPEIRVSGCFIMGNPTETKPELRQTIDFCLKLMDVHPKMSFSLGAFLPFPGVPLYDLMVNEGFVAPGTTEGWEIINRMNEEMEMAWLPWVDTKERREMNYAARYARLLQLGYVRIPLLNRVVQWRLKNYRFGLPVELPLLERMLAIYSDEGNRLGLFLRRLLRVTGLRRTPRTADTAAAGKSA